MSELSNLFDSFYSRFVLRDLLAKVLPGLIVISAVVVSFYCPGQALEYVNSMSGWLWLGMLGLGWLVGFAAQGLGEKVGLIRYFPRSMYANELAYFKVAADFDHCAPLMQQRKHERLVIVMEACGNGFLSFGIAFFLLLITRHLNRPYGISLIFAGAGLFFMHLRNRSRHCDYMKSVIDSEKKQNLE
jgi:hypothetical protein